MSEKRVGGPIVIAAAVAAVVVAYGLIRWLWVEPVAEVNGEEQIIGWAPVIIVTIVAGLIAWGVAVLLQRAGKAQWFPIIGSTALAISIIGPSYSADGASAVALIVLHVVAAIVLIYGLTKITLPERWWAERRPPSAPTALSE